MRHSLIFTYIAVSSQFNSVSSFYSSIDQYNVLFRDDQTEEYEEQTVVVKSNQIHTAVSAAREME